MSYRWRGGGKMESGKRKAWIVRERATGPPGLVIINAGKKGSCKGPITAVRERTRDSN